MTDSGIVIADPDQGTRHIVLSLDIQGQIDVFEPYEDDASRGDNLYGFLKRWDEFRASDEPHLPTIEPRFGHPAFITRNAIERVNWIGLGIRRKEDTRAGVRGLAVPMGNGITKLGDNSYEIRIPHA